MIAVFGDQRAGKFGVCSDSQEVFEYAEQKFGRLSGDWHRDTDDQSVSRRIIGHPAYLGIIAMGAAALPFIFRDLEQTEAFWYPALEAITGTQVGTVADQRKPRLLREAWLRWAVERGYQA
jgi:hypothetical protein